MAKRRGLCRGWGWA